jgi:hypothetical protein
MISPRLCRCFVTAEAETIGKVREFRARGIENP